MNPTQSSTGIGDLTSDKFEFGHTIEITSKLEFRTLL